MTAAIPGDRTSSAACDAATITLPLSSTTARIGTMQDARRGERGVRAGQRQQRRRLVDPSPMLATGFRRPSPICPARSATVGGPIISTRFVVATRREAPARVRASPTRGSGRRSSPGARRGDPAIGAGGVRHRAGRRERAAAGGQRGGVNDRLDRGSRLAARLIGAVVVASSVPRPPTMTRTAPVVGSIATKAPSRRRPSLASAWVSPHARPGPGRRCPGS